MNMTPNDPRTEASTCKPSGTQPENSEAWMASIQALTAKEMTSKAHMQVHTNRESHEKLQNKRRGRTGPKWAQAGRPSPFWAWFGAPFDLAALRTIYSPPSKIHEWNTVIIRRRGAEKDTISERRGSRWLTRVPLAGVGTLHGRPHRSSESSDQDQGRIPVMILSMYYFYVELVNWIQFLASSDFIVIGCSWVDCIGCSCSHGGQRCILDLPNIFILFFLNSPSSTNP
jgi:hypothetical protein